MHFFLVVLYNVMRYNVPPSPVLFITAFIHFSCLGFRESCIQLVLSLCEHGAESPIDCVAEAEPLRWGIFRKYVRDPMV